MKMPGRHKVFLRIAAGVGKTLRMGHRVIGVLPFVHIDALMAWQHQRQAWAIKGGQQL